MSDFGRQDKVLTIRLNSKLIRLKIELNFYLWFHKWAWWFFVFDIFLTKCNITFLIWSLGVNLKPNTWVLKSYNKKFRFHFTLYMYCGTCPMESLCWTSRVLDYSLWKTYEESYLGHSKRLHMCCINYTVGIVNLYIFYYFN